MLSEWNAAEISVTDFGNIAVVGPAAVVVWLWLWRRRGLAAAFQYQWPVIATFIVTVALKIVSRRVGGAFQGMPFELSGGAPSGHMAMSTVIYGGMALMLLRRGVEPLGLLTALVTSIGLIGVGVTRVVLHTHTPGDVVAGFLIGGAGALWAGRVAAVPAREPMRHVAEILVGVTLMVLLLHLSGFRLDSRMTL